MSGWRVMRLPPQAERAGLAAACGLPGGLAAARLLYELDPARLGVLGGLGASLVCGLLASALIWLVSRDQLRPAASLPCLILPGIYIFTPYDQVDPLRGGLLLAGGAGLALSLLHHRWLGRWAGLLVTVGASAGAYLLTLQRTVGRADTFEAQVTMPVLGVMHPTGYPLYTLTGYVFSLLPLGKVATRVNLSAAFFAVVAVGLVYLALRRLKVGPAFAVIGGLALASSPVMWSQAVAVEVYALHNALLAGVLLLCLMIMQPQADDRLPARLQVMLLAGLCGLGLAHHLTSVIALPAAALALVIGRPRLKPQGWGLALLCLCAPLLLYAYIPGRWPALHESQLMPWGDFIAWVTGSRFGGALQLAAWRSPERWQIVGRLALDHYGWPGVALAAGGLIWLAVHNWRAAALTALIFSGYWGFGLVYHVPDVSVFLIPLAVIMAVWAGCALWVASDRLAGRWPPHASALTAAIACLGLLLPLSAGWRHGPGFTWAAEEALEAWGRYTLGLPLRQGAAILADGEKIAPLEYLHRIEGLRADMDMIVMGDEQGYRDQLAARLGAGQPVYLARQLPGLEGVYHLRSAGPLVEVGTEPLRAAPDLHGAPIRWQNGIQLLGYQADEQYVTLYWQAERPVEINYHVYLRLRDQGGQVAWQGRPVFPVSGYYPQAAWKGREIIPDAHLLPVDDLPAGDYTLEVALAPPFSQDYASVVDAPQAWAEVAAITLPGADGHQQRGQRVAAAYPGGALTSLEVPPQAVEGARVDVWAAFSQGGAGQLTRAVFQAGQAAQHEIGANTLTAEPEPGGIAWVLQGADLRCGWLRPRTDHCRLGYTALSGQYVEAVANFENQVLLTAIDFRAGAMQPGGVLDVTLTWQAAEPLEADYTVFVHLLGPDGRLYGQVDSWPVQGTYPTSAWPPGQPITDRYQVTLRSDAPAGSYRVEVGLYLLATGARLNLVDAEGLATGDKLSLEGISVE